MTAAATDFLAFGRRHGEDGRLAIAAVAQLHVGTGAAWEFQVLSRDPRPAIVWWPSRPEQVPAAALALAAIYVAKIATAARHLDGPRIHLTDDDTSELERLARSFIRNERFGSIGYWTPGSFTESVLQFEPSSDRRPPTTTG